LPRRICCCGNMGRKSVEISRPSVMSVEGAVRVSDETGEDV
jgi:hypothetical protein